MTQRGQSQKPMELIWSLARAVTTSVHTAKTHSNIWYEWNENEKEKPTTNNQRTAQTFQERELSLEEIPKTQLTMETMRMGAPHKFWASL